jgi:hypothetical protein
MNIKDLKEKILDEIRYGELNNDMGFVPEWLGKTDMPRHAESVKCFRDGVTCKRYTDAVIVKNAFEEFEKTDGRDTNVPSKWIPCSERLPEHEKDVLVSFKDETSVIAWYDEKDDQWKNSSTDLVINTAIWAWMPLPEPFKESED